MTNLRTRGAAIAPLLLVAIPIDIAYSADGSDGEHTGLLSPNQVEDSAFAAMAVVRVESPAISLGEDLRIECAIRCNNGFRKLFDPFLSEHQPPVAELRIASLDGRLRKQIRLERPSDAAFEGDVAKWLVIGSGQEIGRQFRLRTSPRMDANGADLHVDLPRGEYKIQAVYSAWIFAVHSPTDARPSPLPGVAEHAMSAPLIVSEAVRFTVK